MLEPTEYRRKPTTTTALQWTGDNLDAVREFTGHAPGAHNQHDPAARFWPEFAVDGSGVALFTRGEAHLWVEAGRAWIPLEIGSWVLRGPAGFYPCAAEVFAATYTDAGDDAAALEQLAEILARRLGQHDNAPEWSGNPIVSSDDDESMRAAQQLWEAQQYERNAQTEAMQWALDDPEVRALIAATRPEPDRDALAAAIATALDDALLCSRDWEAWNHRTMTDADFDRAGDDPEFVGQLVDAVLAARPTPGADTPAAELATMTEDRDRLWRALSTIADTARAQVNR